MCCNPSPVGIVRRGPNGMENKMETTIVYRGYFVIIENKMDTTVEFRIHGQFVRVIRFQTGFRKKGSYVSPKGAILMHVFSVRSLRRGLSAAQDQASSALAGHVRAPQTQNIEVIHNNGESNGKEDGK